MLRTHRRWLIIALLFGLSVVNFLDRQTLSVVAHTLRSDLGFGPAEYSYVVSSFLVAYTLGFAFGGRIIDRVGVKASLGAALAFWSAAGMLHALASGWRSLAACRFLLGLAESFSAPAAARAISEWTPQRERGLSMAIVSNGFMVGAMLAPPLVTLVAMRFGWPWAFVATGALGFGFLAAWLRFYDAPERHMGLGAAERDLILAGRGAATTADPAPSVRRLIAHPLCLALVLARLLTDPLSHFLTFWLPEYLQSSRHFSFALVGLLAWIPFLAADVGGPGGGALSDLLVRRGFDPRRARLALMLAGACVMPLSALAVRVESGGLALALIAVMLCAHSCWTVNMLALATDGFPRSQVATVVGLAGMGGSLGGVGATLITGQVVRTLGYAPVFTVFGFVHLAAFGILLIAARRHWRDRPAQASGAPLQAQP